MQFIYLKRSFTWFWELAKTLFQFWYKNLSETPAVLRFFIKKTAYIQIFLDRNVHTEKRQESYQDFLVKLEKMYQKNKGKFNPKDQKSYNNLGKLLDTKQQILYFLIRKIKPEIMVETGVAAGESTGYILAAMDKNKKGKLYSIDLPFQWYIYGDHELHLDSLPPGKLPGYLVPENLKSRWKLILGDTYKKLPQLLKKLNSIDIFLHDSEHTDKTMTFEYKISLPYIKRGGFLLSDDVNFTKAFKNFTRSEELPHIILEKEGQIGITYRKK